MPELDTATLSQITIDAYSRTKTLAELAAPYTLEDLIRAFENLRRSMGRLLNGLTHEQVVFSPDAATYSLSEVVTHLVAAQGNTYNGLLDANHSKLPHIDPIPRGPGAGAEKGVTSGELQERLQTATNQLVEIARTVINPETEEPVDNPIFGKQTSKGWLLFQLTHDLDHLKQAQTLRRSADFPRKVAL